MPNLNSASSESSISKQSWSQPSHRPATNTGAVPGRGNYLLRDWWPTERNGNAVGPGEFELDFLDIRPLGRLPVSCRSSNPAHNHSRLVLKEWLLQAWRKHAANQAACWGSCSTLMQYYCMRNQGSHILQSRTFSRPLCIARPIAGSEIFHLCL